MQQKGDYVFGWTDYIFDESRKLDYKLDIIQKRKIEKELEARILVLAS